MKNKLLMIFGILSVACAALASNEITLQGYLQALKGTRQLVRSPGTITVNWNGSKYYGPIIYSATNAYQSLSQGGIVSNGICWVRNVGTNANIVVSFDNGTNSHMLVKSSEFYCFRLYPTLAAATIQFKTATTATNDFEVTILED